MNRDWQHERGMDEKWDGEEQAAAGEASLSPGHCQQALPAPLRRRPWTQRPRGLLTTKA